MKTQNYGIVTEEGSGYSPEFPVRLIYCELQNMALKNYRQERENGDESDDPTWNFPHDGQYICVHGRVEGNYIYGERREDGHYYWEVRYDAGSNDKKWMEEKDHKYLERVHNMHLNGSRLNEQEEKDLEETGHTIDRFCVVC